MAKLVINTELNTKGFEEGVVSLQSLYERAEKNLGRKLTVKEQMQINEFYADTLKDFAEFEGSLSGTISNIGVSLKNTIKSVAQWSLALFGIRGAYMAIRSSINAISQNDETLKADIDYMKNAMAYVLEPIVRKIVEWAKQLVFYIGWLIKQWTGHDIFASANKNLKKSVGSAKELNKQLAGFDEMNVLSDTSGGGGSDATGPSFAFEDMEPPKWLVVIKDIGQWVIDNWQEVVAMLLLTKLFIDLITGNWLSVAIDLVGLLVMAFLQFWDSLKVIIENVKGAWAIFTDWLMNSIIKPIGEWFSNLWQKIKDGFKSAIDWVKDKFNALKEFLSNIIKTIVGFFKNIGTKVGDAIGSAFKTVINGVLRAVENILNFPIRQINKLLDVINKVPGINISKLSTFSLPRMAKGGIVNMPGRGVPIGSAIAGERSQEGVIPLTDSQQMALLGEAIGKYITINASITNTMNGRVISKELQKINAENDFAYNR